MLHELSSTTWDTFNLFHFHAEICWNRAVIEIKSNCIQVYVTPHFTVFLFISLENYYWYAVKVSSTLVSDRMANYFYFYFDVLYYKIVEIFPNMNKGTEINVFKNCFIFLSHAQAINLMPHHQCYWKWESSCNDDYWFHPLFIVLGSNHTLYQFMCENCVKCLIYFFLMLLSNYHAIKLHEQN